MPDVTRPCPSCDRDVATTAAFCPYCGSAAPPAESEPEGELAPDPVSAVDQIASLLSDSTGKPERPTRLQEPDDIESREAAPLANRTMSLVPEATQRNVPAVATAQTDMLVPESTYRSSPARSASMEYTVVPFTANISSHEGANAAAAQLEGLISSRASEGWEYVRLEQVETNIAGNNGCFGFGATPARTVSASMAVFRR